MKRRLTAFETRWATAVLGAIIPGDLHPQVKENAGELNAVNTFHVMYGGASGLGSVGFRAGLWLLWFLPPLLIGRFRTFGGLSEEERDVFLRKAYNSKVYSLRQLAFLMKLVASAGYFHHPKVRQAFGAYTKDAADEPTYRRP